MTPNPTKGSYANRQLRPINEGHLLCLRKLSGLRTNRKVDGLIPSSSSQLVKVSLDKILNLELPLMHPCECAEKCLVACKND